MKKNPVYRRLLRIEITLILFLILCILLIKSCFGPHQREALQQTPQENILTEPVFLQDVLPTQHSDVMSGLSEALSGAAPHNEASALEEDIGFASYYQDAFHGRPTASGERYDLTQYTAAHRELDFGTRVRVTNIENGKQVTVRINDRGPQKQERVIDLSGQAARAIGLSEGGVAQVRLEVLK